MRINRETRALSFSDCYWTKAEDDSICFEEISPYYKPFWDGNEEFTGQAAPTLYVGGALSKEWNRTESSTNMAIFPWNCNVLSFAGNAEFL